MILQFPHVSELTKEERRVEFQKKQIEEQRETIQKLNERLEKQLKEKQK
jgi:hypothetical protein|tara:strand:- start:385 stop:531 length:147 start_codon:yes stop_codon:yes gene_type:complete